MRQKLWFWLLVAGGVWLIGKHGLLVGWRGPMITFKTFLRKQQVKKTNIPQNERLLQECQIQFAATKKRLEAYEKLLGTPIKPQTKFVEARLISIGPDTLQIVLPDKVSSQSLVNHWVVFGQTVLGQITKVGGKVGWVKLIGNPPYSAQVWVNGQPIWGRLQREGRNLLLTAVPAQIKIAEGDLISVTLPSGDIFLVGKVESANLTSDKLFWEAVIQPSLNPNGLLTVFVIQ